MSRLLATLALLLLGPVAFPAVPNDDAGQRVVDGVAEKLHRLRDETNPEKRIALIKEVGPIKDPRVTVALMEMVLAADWESPQLRIASFLLVEHHIPEKNWGPAKYWTVARLWWEENEADVRRRAEALPK